MPESRSEDEEYEDVAFEIVDEVISKAVQQITSEVKQNLKDISFEFEDKEDYGVDNIEWSTCENFTTSNGITQIEKFVETWKRDSAWLYCIDYLGEEEYDYDVRYRYQVRWSIPTRRKPIPRATACTYFSISLSKIKPKTLPIQVYYIFEGNRLVHRPGKSRFREIWLKNIIESKVLMMETVTF